MSLINDVLRDLEERNATPPQNAGHAPASAARARRRTSVRWPLWLLGAVAVGVVLHFGLQDARRPEPARAQMPLLAQAQSGAQATPAPSPARLAGTAPQQTLQASHLSNHSSADKPAGAAKTAGQSLETVAPAEPAEPVESIEAAEPAPPARAVPEPEQVREKAQPQANGNPRQQQQPAAGESPATAVALEGEQLQPEATISINRSNPAPDASSPLATARRQLAGGQLRRAESQLRSLIAERPELTEAHRLLARAQQQQRRPQAAIATLEHGLQQATEPEQLAALLGRILLQRGETARARAILEDHAPALIDAPDYHLLLAAAHRQAGDHEAAAQHYRALSEVLPRRGAVWVGLGASLEALKQPDEAADAYGHALEGDDQRSASFARRRLSALKPLIGETP